MALRFVLDEHLRGPLWNAIQHHNARGADVIDVTRVGDPADLPLGTLDPDLLLWIEREGRILVTYDSSSMPHHLAAHLGAGHHSPGVILLPSGYSLTQLVQLLVLVAYVGDPADYRDQIRYLP